MEEPRVILNTEEPEAPEPAAPADDSANSGDAAADADAADGGLQPGSRRSQIAEERNREVQELRERQERLDAELAKRDREIAELRGRYDGFTQSVGQQQQQQPAGPDPDELERQAEEALSKENYAEYKRLTKAAENARWEAREQALLGQIQQRIPQPINPMVMQQQMWEAQAGMRFKRIGSLPMQARVNLLHAADVNFANDPWGPDRWEKTYAMAEKMLDAANGSSQAQSQQRPQYSQSTRQILASQPAAQAPASSPGDDDWDRPLSGKFRTTWEMSDMSEKEYKTFLKQKGIKWWEMS